MTTLAVSRGTVTKVISALNSEINTSTQDNLHQDCSVRVLDAWLNRQMTLNQMTANLRLGSEQAVSSKWSFEKLCRAEFHSGVSGHKPLITPGNVQVQWCKEPRQWTNGQWRNMLWSDELAFIVFSTKGRVHVWCAS